MFKYILAAAAALALAAPVAAQAQTVPSYAYAAQDDQEIHGRVTSFDGAYGLAVRDDNGYVDNVALHDGTIIYPTGLELQPGMVVSILGYNAGDAFDANEIDTPYTIDDAVPYYSGHPWNFYGDSIGLSFFFGNTGWWHGGRSVAYGDRSRNVTVVHDITSVRRTNVDETAGDRAPRQEPRINEVTPRYEAARGTTVTQRTDQSAPVARAPREVAPVAAQRSFEAPPQRTAERGGAMHEGASGRGRR